MLTVLKQEKQHELKKKKKHTVRDSQFFSSKIVWTLSNLQMWEAKVGAWLKKMCEIFFNVKDRVSIRFQVI